MAQQASILEAHAAYGVVQHREEDALLRKVSHWPDADVQRETALLSRPDILRTYTLDQSDALLALIDFEAFGGAQP